jgi:hypothetical protein
MSDEKFYIAGILLILVLLWLGWKIVAVSVGPLRVELEAPETPKSLSIPTALGISNQTSSECPGAPSQRVSVGERGRVCTKEDRLIVRQTPGSNGSEITRLVPGTYFTIVGGPQCSDHWSWWKIETVDGIVGWVAEGGDNIDPYFICPIR